ncbi:MAG: choice-of-anchor J domain-containing protein [Bacteroidia bacterium]
MKNSTRIAFLFVLLAAVTTSVAGKSKRNRHVDPSMLQRLSQKSPNQVLSNTIIYSEDFAGGLPVTWQAVDNAGNGVNWAYTTTGIANQGTYPGYDSLSGLNTTAANGYMIYDSDASNGGVGGEDADMITGPVDCSTNSNVHLYFNELIVHYNESATVSVSTDGTTWTQVFDASAGLSQNGATPNPYAVDLDISAIAAGQAAVYIKWNFTGDYDYFWMIDDVALYQVDGTDAEMSSVIAPTTGCTALTNAETVTVSIFNAGGSDFNTFDVSYIVDGNAPVTETANVLVAAGQSVNYSFTAQADFSAPGTHTITAYVSLLGDTNQTNDTVNATIYVGPHPVTTTTAFTNGFEMTDDMSGWSVEDLNNDTISWVLSNVVPHTGSYCAKIAGGVTDDYLYTTCLDLNDTAHYDLTYYYRNTLTNNQANFEVVLASDQNSGAVVTSIVPMSLVTNYAWLPGTVQFQVPASGTYYIGFHVVNGDSLVNFRIDDINLIQNNGVGIVNVEAGKIAVYPNPSQGFISLNSSLTSDSYLVTVTNSIGQVVFSDKFNQLNEQKINLTAQPAGQYIVKVISDKNVYTQKVNIVR